MFEHQNQQAVWLHRSTYYPTLKPSINFVTLCGQVFYFLLSLPFNKETALNIVKTFSKFRCQQYPRARQGPMSPAAPSLQPGLQLILPQNISLSSAINSPTKYLEKLRLSLHVIKWFYH